MTTFRTVVMDIPPSPLGLMPRRWVIEHYCTTCQTRVATDDLVTHATNHTNQPSDDHHTTP